MGVPMALIRAPGILRTLELGNHRADSPQIKFIGTVLACRCPASWLFAHGGIMGMLMGMIRAPADAGTPQPLDRFTRNQVLVDTGTQPLGWFTPNRVHWNRIGLYMCNVMLIYPGGGGGGHNGQTHGHDKGPWNIADIGTQLPLVWLTPN